MFSSFPLLVDVVDNELLMNPLEAVILEGCQRLGECSLKRLMVSDHCESPHAPQVMISLWHGQKNDRSFQLDCRIVLLCRSKRTRSALNKAENSHEIDLDQGKAETEKT